MTDGAGQRPLSALLQRSVDHGRIRFGRHDPPVPTGALVERALGLASDGGSEPSQLAAILTNDRESVELVLSSILVGFRLVSIPLPARGADLDAYLRIVGETCAGQRVDGIVVRDDLAPLLTDVVPTVIPHGELFRRPRVSRDPDGFQLVQFSSGSTGRPKGIQLTDRDLGTNVASILGVIQPRPGDVAVSWLPLSHDMGLVGMLLSSMVAFAPEHVGGGEVVLLRPEDFLRRPADWLATIGERAGSITAAPDFGYRMATRVAAGSTDLSSLRCAIVGGEIVRAETLAGFAEAFAPSGLPATALCPSYGMAEVGLAVSMTPVDERWRVDEVDIEGLLDGARRPPSEGRGALRLVSSGTALAGYEVGSGSPGEIARLRVRAPAIGKDPVSGAPYADADGWHRTGDLGYLVDGHVFVAGRGDDSITTAARSIWAPAVEEAVSELPGVRAGRVVAAGLVDGTWLVAAEVSDGLAPDELGALDRSMGRAAVQVCGARPDHIVLVRRGTLPFTSSGKAQRREVSRAWTLDRLPDLRSA